MIVQIKLSKSGQNFFIWV